MEGGGKQRPSQLLAIFRGIAWEYIPQSPEAIFSIACQLVYGWEIPACGLSPHFLFHTLFGELTPIPLHCMDPITQHCMGRLELPSFYPVCCIERTLYKFPNTLCIDLNSLPFNYIVSRLELPSCFPTLYGQP